MRQLKKIGIVLGVTFSVFFLSFIVLAWNPPSQAPTLGNVFLPINEGPDGQVKDGGLGISGVFSAQSIITSGNIIQGGALTTSSPKETVATIGYVDNAIINKTGIPSGASSVNFYWKTGSGPTCNSGDREIYREQLAVLCAGIDPPQNPLYQGNLFYPHTEVDCVSAGGEVIVVEGSVKICRFNRSACPVGWVRYKNWTKTTAVSGKCCTAPGHDWANIAPESCTAAWRLCAKCSPACGPYYYCVVGHVCPPDRGSCSARTYSCSNVGVSATINQVGCY